MPIIRNNNFSKDSYGARAERLNGIQGSFANIQPELQAPAHIAEWAVDCYDVYMHLWASSGGDRNSIRGRTMDSVQKCALMEKEYQNLRTLAGTIYRDYPVFYKDFGFATVFPKSKNNKIAHVEILLETHARLIAEGLTRFLPELFINRLIAAKEAYTAALLTQVSYKFTARHSKAEFDGLFARDTAILQEIRGWWYVTLGKNDERITMLEMVNPDSGGRKRKKKIAKTEELG